jgi:hypothetical protein
MIRDADRQISRGIGAVEIVTAAAAAVEAAMVQWWC